MTAAGRGGEFLSVVGEWVDGVVQTAVAPLEAQVEDLQGQVSAAQTELAADVAQIASLQAQNADLQAKLDAATKPKQQVVYGTNTGGWFSTAGENIASARDRIKAGFGGQLPSIRVWTSNGVPSAAYVDPTCQVYVCELAANMTDAALDAAFKAALPNSVLVPAHEPETKLTPAAFQTYVARVGAAHIRSGRTDLKVALMLMGNTYDPKRYRVNAQATFWDRWIPNPLPAGVDAIGGDLYPWGADDARADTAATIVGPALAAAQQFGVPFYVGEFGCGSPKWSDAKRAEYTRAAFDLFDAHPDVFRAVCVYEADNGGGGPWCILPKPGTTLPAWPLTVQVVKDRISTVPRG